MDTFVLKHGIHYRQTMMSTEVQQQNATWVQVREAIPTNHTAPGATGNADVGIEVPQEGDGVPHFL